MDVAYSGTRDPFQGGRKLRRSFFGVLFDRYLEPSVDKAERFYVGGARGMDTRAFIYVCENTITAVTIVVPYTIEDQPTEFKEAYRRYKKSQDFRNRIRLVELKSPFKGNARAQAYHARNEYMIDRSELLVANPYERYESTGGTWQSIRYAERTGVARLVASIEEVAAYETR